MKIEIQDWKERNLQPLVDNDIDLIVINETPTCQIQLYEFISKSYQVCPQDPLNQIFVSILNNSTNTKENLDSTRELMWHIDGNYKKRPYNITGLYCIDIVGRADTLFVDNRIVDDIPEYYNKHKDDYVDIDMKKFVNDKRYPYRFNNEREKRMFRLLYGSSKHKLFQEDKRGKYMYYCNGNNIIDQKEYIDNIMYSPERIYSHQWNNKQLVIYNNITTNHKRLSNNLETRHMWKVCGWNMN